MIRTANKPPIPSKKAKNAPKDSSNKIHLIKDRYEKERSQPSLTVRNYTKKQSIDSLPSKPHLLFRDHSGTKLFRPRFSQSPVKQPRSNSSNSNKILQLGNLAGNYKIKKYQKQFQFSQQNPEGALSSSMISSKITFTFKNSQDKKNKHIQYKSPVGKYQNKINTKKLEFNRQISITSTDKSTNSNQINIMNQAQTFVPKTMSFKRKQSFAKKPIIEDFIKGKRLGKGYFGEVFLVQHKRLRFICAMKMISRQLIRRQKTEDQIIRQLKISLFVSHSNIIQTYGYFIDDNHLYILQQLMNEDELYKMMKRRRVLTEDHTADIISQMLQGLDYLHSNQITHRDIKPENILLESGVAKFCDFGWAVYDPNDFRTSYIGTLLYLSPENIKGQGYDRRNDIWGVGVLTYQMLIGNVPFTIWSQNQRHKIIYEQIRFPAYAEISKVAEDFILRMLEKNPDNRASIQQLQSHPFLNKTALKKYHAVSA